MNSIDPVALQALRPIGLLQPGASAGQPPVGGGRLADAAFLGANGAGEFAQAQGRLQRLDLLLTELERLARLQAGQGHTDTRQREIDELIASIDTAAAEVALRRGFEHVALTNISPEVVNATITEANLPPGESLDLEVFVRQSAQQGTLFLRADYTWDAEKNGTLLSSMTLRIAGSRGVTEIQLVSGATIGSLAQAVNSLSEATGVEAKLLNDDDASSGLVFSSTDYGSNAFVSVERLGAPPPGSDSFSTYALADNEPPPAYPPFPWDEYIDNAKLIAGIDDVGQDVVALVDGEPVFGDGASLSFATPRVTGTLELATGALTDPRGANAQNLGALTALTVSVLETGADQGEQATAPELPDQPAIDALRQRVLGRLSFLDQLTSDRLPPAAVSWAGQLPSGVDDPSTLAAHIRAELLGDASLSTHADPQRVLNLLG